MINEQRIAKMTEIIEEKLRPTHLEIINDSHKHVGHAGAKTGLGHFTMIITSPEFDNKSTIECHRMIYDALGDMMETDIHALSINIKIPPL